MRRAKIYALLCSLALARPVAGGCDDELKAFQDGVASQRVRAFAELEKTLGRGLTAPEMRRLAEASEFTVRFNHPSVPLSPGQVPSPLSLAEVAQARVAAVTALGLSPQLSLKFLPALQVPRVVDLLSVPDAELAKFLQDFFAHIVSKDAAARELDMGTADAGERLLDLVRRAHALKDPLLKSSVLSGLSQPSGAGRIFAAAMPKVAVENATLEQTLALRSLYRASVDDCLEFGRGCAPETYDSLISIQSDVERHLIQLEPGGFSAEDQRIKAAVQARIAGRVEPSVPLEQSLRTPGDLERISPYGLSNFDRILYYLTDERVTHDPEALTQRLRQKFLYPKDSVMHMVSSVDENILRTLTHVVAIGRQEPLNMRQALQVNLRLLRRSDLDASKFARGEASTYWSRLHATVADNMVHSGSAEALSGYLEVIREQLLWLTLDPGGLENVGKILAEAKRLRSTGMEAELLPSGELVRSVFKPLLTQLEPRNDRESKELAGVLRVIAQQYLYAVGDRSAL